MEISVKYLRGPKGLNVEQIKTNCNNFCFFIKKIWLLVSKSIRHFKMYQNNFSIVINADIKYMYGVNSGIHFAMTSGM